MQRKTAFISDGDRYAFDFRVCTPDRGWAQLDTGQDAWYFGNWVNPTTREILTYAEGDVTRITCDDDAEFRAEVERICQFYTQNDGRRAGIDPMLRDDLKAAFEAAGLAHWLH